MAGRVFISYRREDAKAEARSIFQRLERNLGRERLFMDVLSIQKGHNFRTTLDKHLATSAILLAIIGPRWLDARDETGARRLDSADDFVRLEIATALKRDIPVVPVLVDGAKLPKAVELPDDLKGLLDHQAATITHENFPRDMDGLERDVHAAIGQRRRRSLTWAAAAGAALLLGIANYWLGIVDRLLGRIPPPSDHVRTDPTRGAESHSRLAVIRDEVSKNVSALSVTAGALASQVPKPFWDKQRPNESELAYQDRATGEFRDYQSSVSRALQLFPVSTTVFDTTWREIGDGQTTNQVRDLYDRLKAAKGAFSGYEQGLAHLMERTKLGLADGERAELARSLHREKLAEARAELLRAAAQFCLLAESDLEAELLAGSLAQAGVSVTLKKGPEGYKAAMAAAAAGYADKAEVLGERVAAAEGARAREIARRVSDPYLVMLRKTMGLGETLSEGELKALQTKALDPEAKDPGRLFELAALAFHESDGEATITYYERALATRELNEWQKKYAERSLERITLPALYDNALGVFVMRLEAGRAFAKAGLQVGDVIVKIGEDIVNEPLEVGSALARANGKEVVATIVRDGAKRTVKLLARQSAGAVLSSLVILNAVQL